MQQKLMLLFCLNLIAIAASSQVFPEGIYIGEVACAKTNAPQKTDKEKSIVFYGHTIMDTANPIEISLSELSIGPVFYNRSARLYYNNGFKLEYLHTNFADTTFQFPNIPKESSGKHSLDSIFSLLVKSGAFNMPHLAVNDNSRKYKYSWLAKNIVRTGAASVFGYDGVEYLFEYKIGKCYGRYIFNNPESNHQSRPDIQIFRRQAEIVAALFLNFEGL